MNTWLTSGDLCILYLPLKANQEYHPVGSSYPSDIKPSTVPTIISKPNPKYIAISVRMYLLAYASVTWSTDGGCPTFDSEARLPSARRISLMTSFFVTTVRPILIFPFPGVEFKSPVKWMVITLTQTFLLEVTLLNE